MAINPWDKLTNDEKLDRLTNVLTRAGSDADYRNRCLASAESAKQAVKEVAEIEFPDDFRVQFITPEERLKSLVLAIPDYIAPEDGTPETRNAEDFQVCTYNMWRA
jgi:hypothetical protein